MATTVVIVVPGSRQDTYDYAAVVDYAPANVDYAGLYSTTASTVTVEG